MFLLGHSCWSYLISKYTGRQMQVDLPLYLALLSGVLPDFDIYFQPPIQHHTITHSLLLLGPVSIILTIRYRRLGGAFSLGILSHLLTDSIVGNIPILYPVSPLIVGLDLGIRTSTDTFLEVGALGVAIVYALQNGDRKHFTVPSKDSLQVLIPLVSIVTLSLLFAGDNKIPLAQLAFSRRTLTAITLGHAVLVTILLVGVAQGIRAYQTKGPEGRQAASVETEKSTRQ